jgi:hypothetical protein
MKKITFLLLALGIVIMMMLSSCSFESYSSHCPTYSHNNKATKYGEKAQIKYARRH